MFTIRTRALATAATAVLLTCTARQTPGIDIILNFDATNSDAPAFDADGSQLTAIMQATESYWEDVIGDSQTITVNYLWDNLGDSTLGRHTGVSFSGNVETEMTLRFDTMTPGGTARNWYFDPTPTNHSEFNLQSQLYRDLATTNQVGGANAWYSGNPQGQFEVAFQGGWVGSNRGVDLFTVALHELGHGLGMTSSNSATQAEVFNDFEYDLPTSLTDGRTIGVQVAGTGSNNALVHIAPTNALMFTGYQGGRTLPSATDVFSMAAVSGWSQIDLPRKYFGSGSSFHFAGNWIGRRVPDSFDDVFILGGNSPVLTQTTFLNALTVEDGSGIDVDDEILFTLQDTNLTARPGGGGTRPVLEVDAGGLVSIAGDLNVDGGLVLLRGGVVEVGGSLRFSDVDSLQPAIVGQGTLRVFRQFTGETDYIATEGGTLEIVNTGSSEYLDVDREVRATLGDITFTDFNRVELQWGSSITVGAGRVATISNLGYDPFNNITLPEINLLGTTTNSSLLVLTGGEASIEANVYVNRAARIQGNAHWPRKSNVQLPDPEDVLILDGLTRFRGATFTGEGRLVQRGDLRVDRSTTIDTFVYDWDGDSALFSNTTIDPYTSFTINSSKIDNNPGSDGYDGVITNFGRLEVNTYVLLEFPFSDNVIPIDDAWRLDSGGVLMMDSSRGGIPQLAGSGVEVYGTVDVFDGLSQSQSYFSLESGGVLNINDTAAAFEVLGTTRLRGGNIIGPGTLVNSGNLYIDTDMAINTAGFGWSGTADSTLTIRPGFDLQVNSPSLGGTTPYIGTMTIENGARLLVNASNTGPWSNDGLIQLNGGETLGQWFTNNPAGEVRGNGTIRGTTHVNDGLLAADNNLTLEIATNGVPDLDGASNNGRIEAINGDFVARRRFNFNSGVMDFHGSIAVGPGRVFQIDSSLALNLFGELESDRGTLDIAGFTNAGVLRGSAVLVQPYAQTPAGTLALSIGGDTAGDFDTIDFNALATLDGVLEITLDNGFTPSAGDSFTLLNTNNLAGTFSTVNLPDLGDGLGWDDEGLYTDGAISVEMIALLGDMNADGALTNGDIAPFVEALTDPAGYQSVFPGLNPDVRGDFTGDGQLTNGDIAGFVAALTGGSASDVPEPGSLALLGLGGLLLSWRRQISPRRSRQIDAQLVAASRTH